MTDYVTREELNKILFGLKSAIEDAIIIGQIAKRFAVTLAMQSRDLSATISLLEQALEHDTTSFLFSGWTDEQLKKYQESYSQHVELLRQAQKELAAHLSEHD